MDCIWALLAWVADRGDTSGPLHLCVATWNVAVVKRWVEVASPREIAGAIDIPSPLGTALCMAAAVKKDHEVEGRELVRILLAAGADPTAQDPQHGRTALHIAAMANDVRLVKIILDAGVDVDIRNVHNTTPLHVALARGAKLCVGLLLSAGANCNMQDDEGDNAFHIAADSAKMIRENLEWLIIMLGNPDAAIEVRNHSGRTLRDYLEALPRECSEDLMEALMNRGVHLSPTIYEIGDWVKFKRTVTTPTYGWQSAKHKSVGFVQNVLDRDNLLVSFCSGEARVLANEVLKLIPLDLGQHVQLKSDVKEPRWGKHATTSDFGCLASACSLHFTSDVVQMNVCMHTLHWMALKRLFVQKVLDRDVRPPYWDKVKHQELEMCAYVLIVSARLNGYTRLEPRGGIADAPYLFKVRCRTCLHEHGDFLYLAVVSNFRTRFLQCQRCRFGGYITLLRDFGVPLYHGCPLDTTTEFQGEAPIACFGSRQFELFQCTLGSWQAICTERQDVGFFEDIVLGQYMTYEDMPGHVRFDHLYFERVYLDSIVEHPPLLTFF